MYYLFIIIIIIIIMSRNIHFESVRGWFILLCGKLLRFWNVLCAIRLRHAFQLHMDGFSPYTPAEFQSLSAKLIRVVANTDFRFQAFTYRIVRRKPYRVLLISANNWLWVWKFRWRITIRGSTTRRSSFQTAIERLFCLRCIILLDSISRLHSDRRDEAALVFFSFTDFCRVFLA